MTSLYWIGPLVWFTIQFKTFWLEILGSAALWRSKQSMKLPCMIGVLYAIAVDMYWFLHAVAFIYSFQLQRNILYWSMHGFACLHACVMIISDHIHFVYVVKQVLLCQCKHSNLLDTNNFHDTSFWKAGRHYDNPHAASDNMTTQCDFQWFYLQLICTVNESMNILHWELVYLPILIYLKTVYYEIDMIDVSIDIFLVSLSNSFDYIHWSCISHR